LQKVQQAFFDTPEPPVDDASALPDAIKRTAFNMGVLFTQMSAAKGVQKHGQLAWNALKAEFEQFRQMDVFEPLDAFAMTEEQKSESLRALSVIKEKRCGKLKGRTVADGSAQREKYAKEDTGSPTVSSDALFLTILIDANENRDVATADISGAYLHALMRDFVSLRFTGWAVDLLCEVNPEYAPYVVYKGRNNTKVLYVRCNKAIYGCVMSGLLWYELFNSVLVARGFVLNPYDLCVANAMINGSQCTIAWYVDDMKVSHLDPAIVSDILNLMESRFGTMAITRGLTHEFLGMTITYHCDGTASIHMPTYIQEAIDESGLNIKKSCATPCASTLFSVDPDSPLLESERADTFHRIVAKLIYVGIRTRTDILLALSFLCSRVSSPTLQDEMKLQRQRY
jgi:Reverse transcriptase (RNA-dependent DNA polymerase)